MAGARTSTRTEHRIDENGFDEAKVFTADGALLRHEVHLPRSTKAIAHFLDIAISFGIWHYSMWGVWALAFQVSLLNLASWSLESVLFVSAIQIAYWTWVVVYQPQYKVSQFIIYVMREAGVADGPLWNFYTKKFVG